MSDRDLSYTDLTLIDSLKADTFEIKKNAII